MSKNPYLIENLITFVIAGDKFKVWYDDGYFVSWTEMLPLAQLFEKITEAKKKYNGKGDYFTLINFDEYPDEAKNLDNPYNFCLSKYDMCFITKTALREHWEGSRPVRKARIHLIQKGLF